MGTPTSMQNVLLAAASAVALWIVSLSVHAQGKAAPRVSAQLLKAKTDYCKTCHGMEGQGFRGSFPMPRLAGQQPEYIANQLQAFIERRRTNPVMFNVAHVLDPAMVKALSEYFTDLNPKPLGGAPKELVPEGKKIYEEGIPSANIPPCSDNRTPSASSFPI
jgi:cytochrome c553